MKSLKGTETEKNILTAFTGESQARNRYTFFDSKAREEGFGDIAGVFEAIAVADTCPACAHPQAHFELLGENY